MDLGSMIVGTVGSLAGDIYSANQNKKEASKNRQFQEKMARNAIQYRAEDLQKAGFNRLLAVTQGGAAQPGGAQANIDVDTGKAVSTGMQAAALKQQLQNMEATNAQINATTAKTNAEKTFIEQNTKTQEYENQINQWKLEALRTLEKVLGNSFSGIDGGETVQSLIGFLPGMKSVKPKSKTVPKTNAKPFGKLENGKPRYWPMKDGRWIDKKTNKILEFAPEK